MTLTMAHRTSTVIINCSCATCAIVEMDRRIEEDELIGHGQVGLCGCLTRDKHRWTMAKALLAKPALFDVAR